MLGLNLSRPFTYVDRLSIRQPPEVSRTPPRVLPIVDNGGIERWQDPVYRQVYRQILDGRWEEYDPFEIDYRTEAVMGSRRTFFRAFQGWLAMSSLEEGGLSVLPLLKEATAYWMLRPFGQDVPSEEFPGCSPGRMMGISKKWHEPLFEHLTRLPSLNPGDTVWWHPDVVSEFKVRTTSDKDFIFNRFTQSLVTKKTTSPAASFTCQWGLVAESMRTTFEEQDTHSF